MSRHILVAELSEKKVEIVIGWDRPLSGYFMTIEDVNHRGDFIFNNLEIPCSHPKELDLFLEELDSLNLLDSVPMEMISEVISDGKNNIGNKTIKHHFRDGVHKREILLNG